MRKQRHKQYGECPIEATLDVIGSKWKGVILFRLTEQTRRFNELRRLLPKVSQKTLTSQLRDLERDGIVQRKIYAQIPPKVEYSLTELGWTLQPVIRELQSWGNHHLIEQKPESKS